MGIKIGDPAFSKRVEKGLKDGFMRQAVSSAQERLKTSKSKAEVELGDWEEWRNLSEEIRMHTLENIDFYLHQLSENVSKNGGHVFFAQTAEDANAYIKKSCQREKRQKSCEIKINGDRGNQHERSPRRNWL